MRIASKLAALALGAAVFVAACDSAQSPTGASPGVARTVSFPGTSVTPPVADGSIQLEGVTVCKFGTDADFDYDVTGLGGNPSSSGSFSLSADTCVLLVQADGAGATVTVTEDLTSLPQFGQLDNVETTVRDENAGIVSNTNSGGPSATATVGGTIGTGGGRVGALFEFTNSVNPPPPPPPPPPGDEGCTPGYYKNLKKHLFAWNDAGWAPTQLVSDMFSEAANSPYSALGAATLHEGLSFQGGDSVAEKAEILLRAGIAGVLNADNPDIAYPVTAAQVIAAVNAALAAGDPDDIVDLAAEIDALNNLGCPIGNGI